MSMTGLPVFDRTVQTTNTWVNDLAAELGWDDKHRAFQGLRVTLHALRDRLTAEEAAHLGSQLPILLGGFYYENWKPATNPSKERSKEEFLGHIRQYFENIQPPESPAIGFEVEHLVRAVFKILAQRVTQGEIEDVVQMLPPELRDLWPQQVSA